MYGIDIVYFTTDSTKSIDCIQAIKLFRRNWSKRQKHSRRCGPHIFNKFIFSVIFVHAWIIIFGNFLYLYLREQVLLPKDVNKSELKNTASLNFLNWLFHCRIIFIVINQTTIIIGQINNTYFHTEQISRTLLLFHDATF